jgi:hypothetical protein
MLIDKKLELIIAKKGLMKKEECSKNLYLQRRGGKREEVSSPSAF